MEPIRLRGIAKEGHIEVLGGPKLPDGAEVTILFTPKHPERKMTAKELAASEFAGDWADRYDLPDNADDFAEWRRTLWQRHQA